MCIYILYYIHWITFKATQTSLRVSGRSPAAAPLAGRQRLARSAAAVQLGGSVRGHGRGDRRAAAVLFKGGVGGDGKDSWSFELYRCLCNSIMIKLD